MDEWPFIAWPIALVIAMAIVVIFPTKCQIERDKRAAEMVQAGADPIAVKCLFGSLDAEGATAMCVLTVERR